MKVSKNWLKELVDLKVSLKEVERLLPIRTIATKEINDDFIELDMKGYNRADLLSLRGVAYEVAAITDSNVTFEEPNPTKFAWVEDSVPKLDVLIEERELCPLYGLAKIEGLKVEPSPADWVQKLSDSGIRSVNNIADITNLIMLEFGQPLHSFDAAQVDQERIIVQLAAEGDKLKTLDDKTRTLTANDLLITDAQKALGLAGVMGGKNSEVTNETTTILLEAAIFDPANLRKTSTRLGLTSEASKRFYHGLTKKRLLQALDAAIKIYQELGGKLTALSISGDTEDQDKKVPLTLKKTQSLIGVKISEEKIEEYLKKLNFKLSEKVIQNSETSWVVTPPYYRLDIEIEEDLIEEVARMYGYENIPPKELEGQLPAKIDQSLFELIYNLKNVLVEEGLTEIQTYSFFSTAVLKNFGWLENQNLFPLIKIANPISAETEYLRHNLWSNLIEKAAENLKYFETVSIFEVGKTYEVVDGKVHEEYRVALLLAEGTENPLSSLNQLFQTALSGLKIKLELGEKVPNPPEVEIFHPNRSSVLMYQDKPVGGMSEVHPRLSHKFGIEKRVAIAEIKLKPITCSPKQ